MFGKKAATNAAEPTVIGRGAVIEGTVRASGPMQVDGRVDGTLQVSGQVSVGPNGAVDGELVADEIVVGGRVQGRVTARKHLHITAGGSARGEVRYGTLQIDRGGLIDGTTGHGQGGVEDVAEADVEELPSRASQPAPAVS